MAEDQCADIREQLVEARAAYDNCVTANGAGHPECVALAVLITSLEQQEAIVCFN